MVKDGGFRSTAPPIRRPGKDTRPPVKGKFADQEAGEAPLRLLRLNRHLDCINEKPPRVYVRGLKRSVATVAPGGQTEASLADNSERSVASAAEPLSEAELKEARRIAKELVRLYRAGAITDAADPQAGLLAAVIHTFEAEFAGRRPAEPSAEDAEPL
jgi:hypothetical protein